jgi:site-specific DNA-methyltransferase (adenine-specific)
MNIKVWQVLVNEESLKHLKTLDDNLFDSCITDPPYHLASILKRFGPGQKGINNRDEKEGRNGPYHRAAKGFMGQTWDGGDIAFQKGFWEQVYRTIKPGAVLLAFAATRNYHRMAVAIEDAGFEIFDMINWIYGTGFPKRKNYLKPAHEPIVMARKGVNPSLNVDDSRIPYKDENDRSGWHTTGADGSKGYMGTGTFKIRKISAEEIKERTKDGRYPANVIHDGSDEVIDEFKKFGETKSTGGGGKKTISKNLNVFKNKWGEITYPKDVGFGDVGTPARFFYSAKATKKEKGDTKHPTVKPLSLMRYLIKLVTPKGGLVLDPFAGTGTTGEACILEDRQYYLIEQSTDYMKDLEKRLNKYNKAFL